MDGAKLRIWAHDRRFIAFGLRADGMSCSVRLSRMEAAEFYATLGHALTTAVVRDSPELIRVTLRHGTTRLDVDMRQIEIGDLRSELGAYLRAVQRLKMREPRGPSSTRTKQLAGARSTSMRSFRRTTT